MPAISSVMCTRNRPRSIGQAVASVLANDHPDFELVIVDQSTDNQTEQVLKAHALDQRLKYIHVEKAGLSAAYNLGISEASASTVAFTDDDCQAPVDWLRSVEAAFGRYPEVEMLYGQTLVGPELAHTPGVVPSFVISEERVLGQGLGFQVAGMGSNFAIQKSLISRIGGFDEALGGGGPLKSSQDFDFLFRAWRSGALTLLSPDVRVNHYGLRAGADWTATLKAYGVGDGAFYMKHVRCGDFYAMKLLAGIIFRGAAREIINPLRRKPSKLAYLLSCLKGIGLSLRYNIDRNKRLYTPVL
jgi:glycosyltransferase involved in cell wall biosynthesis